MDYTVHSGAKYYEMPVIPHISGFTNSQLLEYASLILADGSQIDFSATEVDKIAALGIETLVIEDRAFLKIDLDSREYYNA